MDAYCVQWSDMCQSNVAAFVKCHFFIENKKSTRDIKYSNQFEEVKLIISDWVILFPRYFYLTYR